MTPDRLPVTHAVATLPSVALHYVSLGQGPLVLCLHGFPETWWSWRYQLQPLAEAGFRVVAPDLRGYGDSPSQGPFDLTTLGGDVVGLIEHLGERKAAIVAHDWGGALAWHVGARHPEYVDRLAVLNGPHPAVMEDVLLRQRSWKQLKKSWYMFFFAVPWLPEALLTRNDGLQVVKMLNAASVDRSHFTAHELKPLTDAIQKPGNAKSMVDWYRTIVKRGLFRPNQRPVYDDVTAPSLLFWGMQDPSLDFEELVPPMERLVPKLTIERVADAGHFLHAERPERINPRLIQFLRSAR